MEVQNVGVRPNYSGTKKGALAGAVTTGVIGAGVAGLVHAATMPLKNGATFSAKRAFVEMYSAQYANLGIAMGKTTVSKVIASAKSAVKNPIVIATGIAVGALVGAGLGLVNDLIKNQQAKRAAKTEEV